MKHAEEKFVQGHALSDADIAKYFTVYSVRGKYGRHILKPKREEGILFYTNGLSIRKIQRQGWPSLLQSMVRNIIAWPNNKIFIKGEPSNVPVEILHQAYDIICLLNKKGQ